MIDLEKLQALLAGEGVALTAQSLTQLDQLCEELVSWNERVNLTAITAPDEMLVKHIFDSLTPLCYHMVAQGAAVIDVGCGAGFPGLPVAIARDDVSVAFLDATGKKLRFIEAMIEKFALAERATTLHGRAEELGHETSYRERYDLAFARAMAAPTQAMEYALPFVRPGGWMVAFLGVCEEKTLQDMTKAAKILCARVERVEKFRLGQTDIDRCLIGIKKISQMPTKYPRNNQKISKNPL